MIDIAPSAARRERARKEPKGKTRLPRGPLWDGLAGQLEFEFMNNEDDTDVLTPKPDLSFTRTE